MEALAPIISWLAPIVSAIIITAATASINSHMKRHELLAEERNAKTDEKRREEAEWRERIERRMREQDEKIDAVLEGQCTQMRSDITHKIHRYMDDLHCASTEEKQSLYAEYEVYCNVCSKYGIQNHFVERLIEQVMELPEREI